MNISSFKIRALDRFILNELKAPFFFGLVAFTIILVAGGLLFQMAELIIQQGVSIGIVIRLFIYYMPRLVVFTIPMSCLLAALLGFGVGVTQSTGLAAAVKEAPPQRLAVVNSTFYIFLDVAVGLGPVLMGFILTATGNSYALLYTGLGLFSLAVTAVYFVFRPRRSP